MATVRPFSPVMPCWAQPGGFILDSGLQGRPVDRKAAKWLAHICISQCVATVNELSKIDMCKNIYCLIWHVIDHILLCKLYMFNMVQFVYI